MFALALLTPRAGVAQAPAFAMLYSFEGGSDGASPNGLTLGEDGTLYGTTFTGGANSCNSYGCGTVFEFAPAQGGSGTKTVLYNFSGADGASPSPARIGVFDGLVTPGPGPVFGSNRALYGTTAAGGTNAPAGFPSLGGTVFELAPPATAGGAWTESVLYNLGPGSSVPNTPLGAALIDPGGALYGTAYSNYYEAALLAPVGGAVFKLTPPPAPGGKLDGDHADFPLPLDPRRK